MLEIEHLLAEASVDCAGRDMALAFLAKDSSIPRYVLGRNQQAVDCMRCARVEGVVDDFASADSLWNGVPVVTSSALPAGAVVVNCSTSIRPVSAHRRLVDAGVFVVPYADLMRADSAVPVPSFVAEFRDDYGRNLTRWRELEASLADAESKSVLDALTRFRLSADYRYMASFSVRFDEQYFDPIIALSGSEVFVDCGGYDGDTVLEFLRRVESYERIYMFEPSPVNFERARVRLDAIRDVELVPLGVSDSQSTLSFDAGAGSASAVSESGSTTISVVSIDDYVARPVTYIKMDLEGWELRALMGAKRHIVEDHPKLAVAVYHAAPDFWKVRETVLALRGDYEIYLRHYSEGWSETIMYFIPH